MLWRQPKEEQLYQFDETIFKPKPDLRMPLPTSVDTEYSEEQAFDHVWLWALMGIELLVIMIPLILTGQAIWTIAVAMGVMVMTMALLGSLRLRTRIDQHGVHFQMRVFHWKEQTIPWADIDQIYVRQYSPVAEYGGWGMKGVGKNRAYNVRGNYGIQIVKKDGRRILIGTQRPDEAALHLSEHPLLV